jgi:hypothetical protein
MQTTIHIGYASYRNIKSQIIVPNNILYNKPIYTYNANSKRPEYRRTLTSILDTGVPEFNKQIKNSIIIDNFNMLPFIKRVDLYEFMNVIKGNIIDENEDILLPAIDFDNDITKEEYYRVNYHKIYYILHTYPGIFIDIEFDYIQTGISIIRFTLYNIVNLML